MAWFNTPLDAVLVDLDGTLVDTVGDFDVALGRAMVDVGYAPVSRAFIERTVGKGSGYLLRRVLEEVGAAAELEDAAYARYQHHYLQINGAHSTVYPGAIAGLQALRDAGLRLACVTNKPTSFMRPLLDAKGLAQYFDHAFGGDAFVRGKPDPLPLIEACKALGTTPARTLMVGDSRNDADAARAAGCPVVLLSYGYNHGEPAAAAEPDAVIDSIADIAPLLTDTPQRRGLSG